MPLKEKAHQNGGPIPDHLSSQDTPETAENLESRQARTLLRLFSFCQATANTIASLAFAVSR